MSDYQMGKDITELKSEVQSMQAIIQQLCTVVNFNIKKENLEEPKESKK